MGINNFKTKSSVTLNISVDCNGQFDPFTGIGNMQWTLTGNIFGQTGIIPEVREITCSKYPQTPNVSFYEIDGSTGFTSGTIPIGIQPEIFFGDNKGLWKVNTEPVLQQNGQINNQDVNRLDYYVVAVPQNKTEDDPVLVSPQIDGIFRVYPGDFICVDRESTVQKWKVYPKFRLPKTDRTFFWSPNSSPYLQSGGLAGGELAKPGTIMIPDENYYIASPNDSIDGMKYFYKGHGVLFDGQKWSHLTQDPFVLDTEEGVTEFWYRYPLFSSPNYYERRLEWEQTYKYKLNSTFVENINEQSNLEFAITFEGETTIYPTQVVPNFPAIFVDHGDAYSKHEIKTRQFAKTNNLAWYGAQIYVNTEFGSIVLDIDFFEDNNNTTYETEGIGFDFQPLTNNFNITTEITVV